MKYTIEGFSQEAALSLSTNEDKIDMTDLVLLRYFVDFFPNTIKVEVDGEPFAWISYGKIIEDLPLLNLEKRAIARRFSKLCKLGILAKSIVDNNATVFGFGENYFTLVGDEITEEQLRGVGLKSTGGWTQKYNPLDSKVQGGWTQKYNHIYTIINKSNNIYKRKKEKEEKEKEISPPLSFKENEKKETPYPLKERCQKLVISQFEKKISKENLELLLDYSELRFDKNEKLTYTEFKASILSLQQILEKLDNNKEEKDEITKAIIIQALSGGYNLFKPVDYKASKKGTVKNQDTPSRAENFDPKKLAHDSKGGHMVF